MEKAIPIETIVGLIKYRDAIFLDSVESDGYTWSFTGELNGGHITKNSENKEWVPFKFLFKAVQNVFSCGIECVPVHLFPQIEDDGFISCFYRVENSRFLKNLPVREGISRDSLVHFCLMTYDMAFHIIAEGYELEIPEKAVSPSSSAPI